MEAVRGELLSFSGFTPETVEVNSSTSEEQQAWDLLRVRRGVVSINYGVLFADGMKGRPGVSHFSSVCSFKTRRSETESRDRPEPPQTHYSRWRRALSRVTSAESGRRGRETCGRAEETDQITLMKGTGLDETQMEDGGDESASFW